MRFLSFALGGLLLTAALPTLAQTAAEAPVAPRFYIGLAAYSSYYQKVGLSYGSVGFPVPMQLTAGYQLRPRLAVQVGLAYSGASDSYFGITRYFTTASPKGVYYQQEGSSTTRNASASVLARYTLTRNLAHRFQVDVLGGVGLERRSYHNRGTEADSLSGRLQTTPYDYTRTQNTLLLSVGAGARYRVGQRFELTYDLLVSDALPVSGPAGQFQGLTTSSALGLRYRFGR